MKTFKFLFGLALVCACFIAIIGDADFTTATLLIVKLTACALACVGCKMIKEALL